MGPGSASAIAAFRSQELEAGFPAGHLHRVGKPAVGRRVDVEGVLIEKINRGRRRSLSGGSRFPVRSGRAGRYAVLPRRGSWDIVLAINPEWPWSGHQDVAGPEKQYQNKKIDVAIVIHQVEEDEPDDEHRPDPACPVMDPRGRDGQRQDDSQCGRRYKRDRRISAVSGASIDAEDLGQSRRRPPREGGEE